MSTVSEENNFPKSDNSARKRSMKKDSGDSGDEIMSKFDKNFARIKKNWDKRFSARGRSVNDSSGESNEEIISKINDSFARFKENYENRNWPYPRINDPPPVTYYTPNSVHQTNYLEDYSKPPKKQDAQLERINSVKLNILLVAAGFIAVFCVFALILKIFCSDKRSTQRNRLDYTGECFGNCCCFKSLKTDIGEFGWM